MRGVHVRSPDPRHRPDPEGGGLPPAGGTCLGGLQLRGSGVGARGGAAPFARSDRSHLGEQLLGRVLADVDGECDPRVPLQPHDPAPAALRGGGGAAVPADRVGAGVGGRPGADPGPRGEV